MSRRGMNNNGRMGAEWERERGEKVCIAWHFLLAMSTRPWQQEQDPGRLGRATQTEWGSVHYLSLVMPCCRGWRHRLLWHSHVASDFFLHFN